VLFGIGYGVLEKRNLLHLLPHYQARNVPPNWFLNQSGQYDAAFYKGIDNE